MWFSQDRYTTHLSYIIQAWQIKHNAYRRPTGFVKQTDWDLKFISKQIEKKRINKQNSNSTLTNCAGKYRKVYAVIYTIPRSFQKQLSMRNLHNSLCFFCSEFLLWYWVYRTYIKMVEFLLYISTIKIGRNKCFRFVTEPVDIIKENEGYHSLVYGLRKISKLSSLTVSRKEKTESQRGRFVCCGWSSRIEDLNSS